MKKTIKISNSFPTIISTRKLIAEYCYKLKLTSKNVYVLDFKSITFISRSCADEFVKTLNNAKIRWELKNANTNIQSMFEAVKNTQKGVQHDYDIVAITTFLNKQDLSKFLSAI